MTSLNDQNAIVRKSIYSIKLAPVFGNYTEIFNKPFVGGLK